MSCRERLTEAHEQSPLTEDINGAASHCRTVHIQE